MNTLKIGDKVRYVNPGVFEWEDVDEADQAGLIPGEIVTVTDVDASSVMVAESLNNFWIHYLHFQKV